MEKDNTPAGINRRTFLGRSAIVVGGVIVALPAVLEACSRPENTSAPSASGGASPAASLAAPEMSDFGVVLPGDAAPKAHQYIQLAIDATGLTWASANALDSLYGSIPGFANLEEHLIRVDKDWQILPAQAERWEVGGDGVTWTFTLRKGLKWSNGDEVTADDYVATFRHAADPKHAWDFSWYFDGIIKNFGEAVRGEAPVDSIGVATGATPHEVVFTTVRPVPFLPAMFVWSAPMHAKSLAQFGSGIYNTNPKTAVTCGPYLLEENTPEKRIVYRANPNYTGTLTPMLDRQVFNIVSGGSDLQRYQAGEIDAIGALGAGDMKTVNADAALRAQLRTTAGDFRCFYAYLDTTVKPFDDKRVRLAFAKSIDREGIAKGILAPLGLPAYSYLAPGFPDNDAEGLKPIQAYDPDGAKQLLAEAGYPGGQGFPATTLVVRGGGPDSDATVTQAVAASISQVLGVKIDLQSLDRPVFMDKLTVKREIPFGYLSYGMDFLDATNMLSVWKSNGRHNWNNAEFDRLVTEGGSITNDPGARSKALKDAERLLIEDAPILPIYFAQYGQLHKPYRKGSWQEPNKAGFTGSQWPGETPQSDVFNTMYYGTEVLDLRKA